jgi:archaellum biogenesis ATPase FlaH
MKDISHSVNASLIEQIIEKNFKVVPNFDLAQITSFSLYGSLQKRLSSSITKVINNDILIVAHLKVRITDDDIQRI